MNKALVEKLAVQSLVWVDTGLADGREQIFSTTKFAELIVEETLKQVDERTYCRGETSWYNDDKDWIRLHFGYGKLAK